MITLQEFLDEKIKLPSPTAIALRILEDVRKDEDSFADLAETIKSDPALTARVLKIANSSLYGLAVPVSSPQQAIAVIGTQALKNIALSFVIVEGFNDAPQGSFDLNLFWRRAITSAVAAETLAKQLSCGSSDIFVSSLLQDFGVLVLFLSYGPLYTEVLDNKRISGRELYQEELKQFGFHHAEVGAQILESWNLPESISRPVRFHHHLSEKTCGEAPAVLNLADKIASIYHGTQSNRRAIEVQALLQNDHDFTIQRSSELIDTIGEKALEVIHIFSIPPGGMKPFSQIMQEANAELGRLNYSYEQLILELTQAKQNAERLALELKRANDSLRELTLRDSLTSLYNHRYFQDSLEAEIEKSIRYNHPLSILLLDIDFFKAINDNYGHPMGDYVLTDISNLLVKLVRNCDVVARYGGEEFGIILPETATTGAKVLAQRVRRGIEQHTMTSGNESFSVTVSVGLVATEPGETDRSRKALISQCDKALYAAKRNGRNRVEIYKESTSLTHKANLLPVSSSN